MERKSSNPISRGHLSKNALKRRLNAPSPKRQKKINKSVKLFLTPSITSLFLGRSNKPLSLKDLINYLEKKLTDKKLNFNRRAIEKTIRANSMHISHSLLSSSNKLLVYNKKKYQLRDYETILKTNKELIQTELSLKLKKTQLDTIIDFFTSNKNKPYHINDVANATNILVPNVRRILGQGVIKNIFERVEKGIYKLKKESNSKIPKSYELILVGFFLSKTHNKTLELLNVESWKDAYLLFYNKLSSGRTINSFSRTLKNSRDWFDSHLPNNRRGWHEKDKTTPTPLTGYSLEIFKQYLNYDDKQLLKEIAIYIDRDAISNTSGRQQSKTKPQKKPTRKIQLGSKYKKTYGVTKTSTSDVDKNDLYIKSLAAKKKTERANQIHQSTLNILNDYLDSLGYSMNETIHIDGYAQIKSSFAIFEVKSIHKKNEVSQIRHAISQLLEYRYFYEEPDATLWMVLSNKPSNKIDKSYLNYIRDDRKIKLLWLEDNILNGPDIEQLI